MSTLEKIKKLQKFGSIQGLNRIKKLMELLGNPQNNMNVIHIGGTNGKGSVANYIYSILRSNGYKTGMFTSPFMEGFTQSIIVDDVFMTESELDSYYSGIEAAIWKMEKEGFESPTEFEVITALGVLYFAKHKPDFVIMEVGLGGRGDSTNIFDTPVLSVITSIAFDHCEVLGDTIEKIAYEKAGIIKPGVPVVSNVTEPAAVKVIAEEANYQNAPLTDATEFKPNIHKTDTAGSLFSVNIQGVHYDNIRIGMAGEHQIRNAVCALTAIEQIRKTLSLPLEKNATLEGLKKARLAGRFEIIKKKPIIIMDGAHNEEGATALSDSINRFYPGKKILTVFTLMKDKNAGRIIDEFISFSNKIIIADILKDKNTDTKKLSALVDGRISYEEINEREKLLQLIKQAYEYDIVLITGSLYLIRDIHNDLV